ncbi:EIN3-binding F-box protein 1-like isoform X2 [Magnolia sinica]|uniref:EIN3-binding F-box protein 1-like isoform X1 n=1 Tax=Magnolia sinica TaxID=86752 RepID=UPI002657B5F5|nr:EIN3-binding F-box protein 1-like isoform X1 [Magnolia sinica]XP_058113330.1 EIN3-binding F-box protein 1-like isoform X2 [Magnolia sinica]
MPAVVNCGGDKDFCAASSFHSDFMDSCLVLSLGSHIDVYCPPRKRSRITAPFIFRDESKEPENQSSIDVLPDECLFEIFRRLPGSQERSACACVSKRWLMLQSSIRRSETFTNSRPSNPSLKNVSSPVSKDEQIVSSVQDEEQECEADGYLTRCLEGKKATDIRLASIAVGTSSRGGLGKLLIRGTNYTRGVSNHGLSAIARGCPSLRVLSLWNVSSISDEGLSEIANGCHMLEKLDLCQCPLISDQGLLAIAQNCPSLTELTIESCLKIGNKSLQAIARNCLNLKSISIKDCPLVGDQGVANLASSASSVLRKIKLEAVNITDVSLAVIGHYGKAVMDLVLTGLQNVSERGFWVLGNASGLQNLKSFTIANCQGLTDLGLEAIGKGCPNLRQLHIRRCSLFSDEGLNAFTKSGASLESLQLEECNRITQTGVLRALSNCGKNLKALALIKCLGFRDTFVGSTPLSPCESLRSLTIRNCPGFGSAGIAMVGTVCPRLQHVDFGGLYGATDAGLLALLESCKAGLLKVNLTGCFNISDAVVSAMARLHGETLQLLNLDGCRKVTDESLSAIADNCLLLTDLDMSRCTVTDNGIAALARAKQLNLQVLSLSGCSHVSDIGVALLQNMGQSLVGLNLQQCNLITSSVVELLEEQLWRCDVLF